MEVKDRILERVGNAEDVVGILSRGCFGADMA